MATAVRLSRASAVRATSVIVAVCAVVLSGAAHPASAVARSGECQRPALVNGSFENPKVLGNAQLPEGDVPGWKTTDSEHLIEIWSHGLNGVPARDGKQFAEINATSAGMLFQDVRVTPGDKLQISFEHRGRTGVDTMGLSAGEPGGKTSSLGVFKTGNKNWKAYSAKYTVPGGQTILRLGFTAVSTAGGPSVGNFLDGVKIKTIGSGCRDSHNESRH